MRLLVGLGNPGEKFEHTRHNIGFVCLDKVATLLSADKPKDFMGGQLYEVRVEGEKALLFKPLKYMNRSGMPVRQVMDYYGIGPEKICIMYDDVYIAPGSIRVRRGGGDGGHNGIKSLLEHVKPDLFWRIRIGVGIYEQHPEKRLSQPPLDAYVTGHFPSEDQILAQKAIDKIAPNLVEWLKTGELAEATHHL